MLLIFVSLSLSLILSAKLDWSSVSRSRFGNTDDKDQLKKCLSPWQGRGKKENTNEV